jgi:hypothetical protein
MDMNLVDFITENPMADVRGFIRARLVPPGRQQPYNYDLHVRQLEWGWYMSALLAQGDVRAIAEHMNIGYVGCKCDAAADVLRDAGWWLCADTEEWQSPSEERCYVSNEDHYVCQDARENGEYYRCDECGNLNSGDPEICEYDGDGMYCRERCARNAGLTQDCDGDWRSYICDCGCCDEDEDDDYQDNNGIYSYSSYPGGLIGAGGKYNVGTEIEIEFKGCSQRNKFIDSINTGHKPKEVFCKQDGSLGSYGIEAVTGYGQYSDMAPIIKSICEKALAQAGRSHNTTTCGQHVAVSRQGMSHEQQARFVVFFNLPDNQAVLKDFARRSGSSWSRTDTGKANDAYIERVKNDRGFYGCQKYEAVNCCHDTHLEVRIFKGSLRLQTALARMALVAMVAEYCESELTAKELTVIKFMQWIQDKDCAEATVIKEYIVHREAAKTERSPLPV